MSPHSKIHQYGFTLVELAVALMIIGLLLGGILKGKELWENSRVTSQIRQIEGYKAAITTFRSSYGATPGDIRNPQDRVPDCTTSPCNLTGDGSEMLTASLVSYIPFAAENRNFWLHLARAGLINDIDVTSTRMVQDATFEWGPEFPKSAFEETGLVAFSYDFSHGITPYPGSLSNMIVTTTLDYWSNQSMPVKAAIAIDRKMDDGRPWTGSVTASANGDYCYVAGVYNTAPSTAATGCHLLFLF